MKNTIKVNAEAAADFARLVGNVMNSNRRDDGRIMYLEGLAVGFGKATGTFVFIDNDTVTLRDDDYNTVGAWNFEGEAV